MENYIGFQDIPHGATGKIAISGHAIWGGWMVYSGLQTKSRLWGKSFSHPRSMHTPFKLSFLPRSSQMKSLYSGKQQALSLLSLGYEESKREMDVFLWELAPHRRKEMPTPIQACFNLWRRGTREGAKLAKESVGKSSILSLIPARKGSSFRVPPTLFFFLLKGFG